MDSVNFSNNPEHQINNNETTTSYNKAIQPTIIDITSFFYNFEDQPYNITLEDGSDLPDHITVDTHSHTISIVANQDIPSTLSLRLNKFNDNNEIYESSLIDCFSLNEEQIEAEESFLSNLFTEENIDAAKKILQYLILNKADYFKFISNFLKLYNLAKPECKHLFIETYAKGEYTFEIKGYPSYQIKITDTETINILLGDLNDLALTVSAMINNLHGSTYNLFISNLEQTKQEYLSSENKKAVTQFFCLLMLMEKRLNDGNISLQQQDALTRSQANKDDSAFQRLFIEGGILIPLLKSNNIAAIDYFIKNDILFKNFDISKQPEGAFKDILKIKDSNAIAILLKKGMVIPIDKLITILEEKQIKTHTINNILCVLFHTDIALINNYFKKIMELLTEKKYMISSDIQPLLYTAKKSTIIEFYFMGNNIDVIDRNKDISNIISVILHINYNTLQPYIHKLLKHFCSNDFTFLQYNLLDKSNLTNLLNLMHKYIDNSGAHDLSFITGKYNSAFNLLVFTAINSNDKLLINNAKLLYEKYIKLPKVQRIISNSDFKFLLGNMDGEAEVDWDDNAIAILLKKGMVIPIDKLITILEEKQIKTHTINNILCVLFHTDIALINNYFKKIMELLTEKKYMISSDIQPLLYTAKKSTIIEFYFMGNNIDVIDRNKDISNIISVILHINYNTLQPYIHKLLKHFCSNDFAFLQYNLLDKSNLTNLLNLMHKYIDNSGAHDLSFITGKYNSAFNLLVFTAINSNDKLLINNAKLLYEKYIKLPKVQRIISNSDFKFLLGNMDGEAEVDWDDIDYRDFNNYIFIRYDLIMLLSTTWLDKFLKSDQETFSLIDWNQICLFDKEFKNINLTECKYELTEIFSQCFPIFKNHFLKCYNFGNLTSFIQSLSLEKYEKLFIKTLATARSKTKLVSSINFEADLRLSDILEKNINFTQDKTADGITDKHLLSIKEIFNLHGKHDSEIAQYLVCIAAIFIKFSSSRLFGTENESINSLRLYAYTLLQQARALDAESIALAYNSSFEQLKQQLIGNHSKDNINSNYGVSCSDGLSRNIMEEIERNYPKRVINRVIPTSWR